MGRVAKNNAPLKLENIALGYPGLTPAIGLYVLEACVVTLYRLGYKPGIKLLVKGDRGEEIVITWTKKITAQIQMSWKDQEEATEMAATCISILLAFRFTGYRVVERSVKKTGFDYWLGKGGTKSGDIFTKMARLEISGIFKGDEKKLERRVKEKLEQTKQSDSSSLPAHISVIEFSKPQCKFVSRK